MFKSKAIKTVRTKIANIFATRFSPELDAETLEHYLKDQVKMKVKCRKITSGQNRFASFQVTAECADPKVLLDPLIWPEGAFVRWYYEPRKTAKNGHPEVHLPNTSSN